MVHLEWGAWRLFDYIPNPLVVPIGLAIGVVVAAPVGPVNVLCMQRALERGFLAGVAASVCWEVVDTFTEFEPTAGLIGGSTTLVAGIVGKLVKENVLK